MVPATADGATIVSATQAEEEACEEQEREDNRGNPSVRHLAHWWLIVFSSRTRGYEGELTRWVFRPAAKF
jgi:hypothetical protein